MTGIIKVTKTVSQIAETLHWMGAAVLLVVSVGAKLLPGLFLQASDIAPTGTEVEVYGFELTIPAANGTPDTTALLIFGLGGALLLGLMAMIFRNLKLILTNSENGTPFQSDNVHLLKEIGIFAIAGPIVGLVFSLICRLALGVETAETSVDLYGIWMGLAVLCLTQFFAHGVELERDVDGLV